ncbi:hypothetical protein [Nostoc sp. NMS4]|uniref:hypothetical protein n=1 Tax=Nostoc sp. NMS4 TaxID=2815390 RepID=UPI0025E103E9|nr:hypothetical protein [Nostoc sp. NMS4]MBN3924012.1 hypothetical protein [Nostoc sp. NMS4]
MYYVISQYYVEAGCELLDIVEIVPKGQAVHIKLFSENYDDCADLVDLYAQELNEQVAFEEANLG